MQPDEQCVGICGDVLPSNEISVNGGACRGMQWQQAALLKLCFEDQQAIIGDIFHTQCNASEMRNPVAASRPNKVDSINGRMELAGLI